MAHTLPGGDGQGIWAVFHPRITIAERHTSALIVGGHIIALPPEAEGVGVP